MDANEFFDNLEIEEKDRERAEKYLNAFIFADWNCKVAAWKKEWKK